jgi:hypothetical protein
MSWVMGLECALSSALQFCPVGFTNGRAQKSRYPLHMYYTICGLHVSCQLMNMKLLEQILSSCIIAGVVHTNAGQNVTLHTFSLGLFFYHFLHMMSL